MTHPSGLVTAGGILGVIGLALAAAPGAGQSAREDSPYNRLTPTEKARGWRLLFDGRTTHGWRKYRGKTVPDTWKVVDEALVFTPKEEETDDDIVTADRYENFELMIDWKVSPGGNSGIMYRVGEDRKYPWETGPEYQIVDNARHPDGKDPLTSAASCYAIYAPSRDVTRPAGQWNRARLIVDGDHVEHWLNGVKVVDYELGSTDWQRRVRASKFREMPQYGRLKTGVICLQDHHDRVEFRNIKIRTGEASERK